jgi:GNAT superfamily N-acetyltransferase
LRRFFALRLKRRMALRTRRSPGLLNSFYEDFPTDLLTENRRGEFTISTDRARLDLSRIHDFLTNCYWAKGIPKQIVARSIERSLCFGIYNEKGAQIGFARVISDNATFAYIGDVFVLEPYRGRGLSKWLMQCIKDHPQLQGLRRWCLVTRDAHELYSQFGFKPLASPDRWMELRDAEVYTAGGRAGSQ